VLARTRTGRTWRWRHGTPRRRGALRRALLALPLACLLAGPSAGCLAREQAVNAPHFETRLVLKNDAGKEERAFLSGERITFVVTLRNRSESPRTLSLPTSQTHDCFVYAAGDRAGGRDSGSRREIWRHSRGRMFAQVITELTLAPGESRSFTAAWDQAGPDGRPVPPGEYEAVGLVPGKAPGCRSDEVPFTIRPAAGGRGP